MEKFVRLSAKACPLPLSNLNTDQILPARYLKWPRSKGLGTVLFQDLRFDADGNREQDFPLNQPSMAKRKNPCWPAAISAAAPHAKRRSMLSTIMDFAASSRRRSAISSHKMRSRTDW